MDDTDAAQWLVTKDAALPQLFVLISPVLPNIKVSHVITKLHMKRSQSVCNILIFYHWEQNMNPPLSARRQMQSLQRKHPKLPTKTKFRTQPTAGKVMLMVLWDSQGLILEPCGEEFNSQQLPFLKTLVTPTNTLFYNCCITAIT